MQSGATKVTTLEPKPSPQIATAERVEARIQLKRVIESDDDDDDDEDFVSPTSEQMGLQHIQGKIYNIDIYFYFSISGSQSKTTAGSGCSRG